MAATVLECSLGLAPEQQVRQLSSIKVPGGEHPHLVAEHLKQVHLVPNREYAFQVTARVYCVYQIPQFLTEVGVVRLTGCYCQELHLRQG